MALFRYEAVDRSGKVVRGVMDAANEQEVLRNLSARGYAARGIQLTSSPSSARLPAAPPAVTHPGSNVPGPRRRTSNDLVSVKSIVPPGGLAVLFRQLAIMVRAGMPLTQAFTEASRHVGSRHLSNVVSQIQCALNAGKSLSAAMAAYPCIFPVHSVAVVWCGELSGKLEVALDDVATDFELEASETRYARIGWALTKVTLIGLILTLPFFNIGALIAPLANGTAVDSRSALSVYLSEVSRAVFTLSLPLVVFLMGGWIAWGHIKRIASVKRLLDAILLRIPPWGQLHRWRSLTRFLKWMELTYSAGVNPVTAWEAASLTARNSEIADRLRSAREHATANIGVGEMARISGMLPDEEVALIHAAEKSGDTPATLARLASMYAEKSASQKTIGRAFSFSLFVAFQLAVGGLAMIVMTSTYFRALYKLMGF